MESVQRARRGLSIFFTIVVLGSAPLQIDIARNGLDAARFFPLVWIPALASIVARLALREGFSDISFRFDRRVARSLPLGIVYPFAVGLPAYGLAWTTGIVTFEPATLHPLGFVIPGETPVERLVMGGLISITVGPLAMAVLALGEEIGWRGYMLSRLVDARVPQPALVSGLVWSLWHAPLILSGQYSHSPKPVLALALFTVTMTSQAFLMARMRLETGSIWPVVLMHAAWNAIIVSFFEPCTQGQNAPLWTGETGVLGALSTTLVTALLLRLKRSTPAKVERTSASRLETARL